MMVEKESGEIENPKFPPLWVAKVLNGGLKRLVSILHRLILYYAHIFCLFRYWNSVTGHSQHHPPPLCLGGLLADVSNTLSGA